MPERIPSLPGPLLGALPLLASGERSSSESQGLLGSSHSRTLPASAFSPPSIVPLPASAASLYALFLTNRPATWAMEASFGCQDT